MQPQATRVPTIWQPLAAAVLVVGLMLAFCLTQATARCGGTFVYALDDAYIHLALARNLAENGTWGLHGGEFAAASSSPLWTVTLAGLIRVFGPQPLLPLVLNLALTAVALYLAAGLLHDFGAGGPGLFFCLLVFAAATPLPALVFGGMEHVLQVCLCVAFLRLLLRALDGPPPGAAPLTAWAILSFLMPVTRYEDLFLIAAASGVLAWRRRWASVVLALAPAAVSVSLFGLYFVLHGGGFLPNPLLIKGQTGVLDALVHPDQLPSVLVRAVFASTTPTHVFVLVGALLAMTLWPQASVRTRLGCLVVLLTFLAHTALAQTGWFYRYEAYLVGLSLLCLATAIPWQRTAEEGERRPVPAYLLVAVYLALPIGGRALDAFGSIPAACGNIHDQQVQMADFVRTNYDGDAVALNDIGAVSFGTDAQVLDLYGLGCNEIARLKRDKRYDTPEIDRVARARGVKLVVVYDAWFRNETALPAHWVKVGTWTLADNVVCGSDTVSFYALDADGAVRLRRALEQFADRLPSSVRLHYEPTAAERTALAEKAENRSL
jgi:hypothetical protein